MNSFRLNSSTRLAFLGHLPALLARFRQAYRDSLPFAFHGFAAAATLEGAALALVHRAISAALVVAELITNATKYAYEGQPGGKIWVRVARADNGHIVLSVRDEGAGLPAGFDPQTTKSLGMRIITAFAQQLGGHVQANRRSPGTEFVVSIPLANEPGPSARKD